MRISVSVIPYSFVISALYHTRLLVRLWLGFNLYVCTRRVHARALVQAIAKQVLFRERTNLMDKDSLEDAETSLQNMLRDFVRDRENEVPEDLRCDDERSTQNRGLSCISRFSAT